MYEVHYKPLDVQKVASTFTVEGLSTNSIGKLVQPMSRNYCLSSCSYTVITDGFSTLGPLCF